MKKTILTLAAVAMLAACDQLPLENGTANEATQGLMFTTAINQLTKATDSDFESGDVVAVTAYDASGALVKDAAQYTHNGSLFMSSDPIMYAVEGETYSFYSVYPTVSSLQTSIDFYAESDQSVAGAYAASDMLFASVSSSESIPKLSFYHKMSSIVINIVGDDSGSIFFNGKCGLRYGVTTNSVETLGNAVTLTPAENGTASYKLILAPQTVTSGTTFATYTVGNLVYDWVLEANLELASGSQYVYNWNLADREVTLESVIVDWNSVDGGTIESK